MNPLKKRRRARTLRVLARRRRLVKMRRSSYSYTCVIYSIYVVGSRRHQLILEGHRAHTLFGGRARGYRKLYIKKTFASTNILPRPTIDEAILLFIIYTALMPFNATIVCKM